MDKSLYLILSTFLLLFGVTFITPTQNTMADGGHVQKIHPSTALRWLKNGNTRFVKSKQRNDGKTSKDRIRLSKAQHPHTIVLSCSDSRVPPEIVFDQALGEIFVIRVAGEALDNSVIGSIEYAVEHLNTQLILVMGHTECGAVKAAIQTPENQSAGSRSIDHIVTDIRPRLGSQSFVRASSHYADESAANARKVAAQLESKSKIIFHKVHSGELKITSGLYHLDTGIVDFDEQ